MPQSPKLYLTALRCSLGLSLKMQEEEELQVTFGCSLSLGRRHTGSRDHCLHS
ncbi:rCG60011 [Rattus norvegicus]|uniref:RCG60011 n=1 Tax=Rattus norvegicus TaxID=10116 RepID=A6HQZ1_RAT|nr:rCG60011 [Rattus norvegicus]